MESLFAGATAGLVVDLTLYPIDTIKTRLQSKDGFYACGGFRNIYKGLTAVAIGSVPGGAVFFFTYDNIKKKFYSNDEHVEEFNSNYINKNNFNTRCFVVQSFAAICGETAACSIRVPVEMVKQRMQAGQYNSVWNAICEISHSATINKHTDIINQRTLPYFRKYVTYLVVAKSFFTGMPIMLLREWPFSVVQMSLYEYMKSKVRCEITHETNLYWWFPLCGIISGGCAAFVTTPLDVVKTRIMLETNWQSELSYSKLSFHGRIRKAVVDIMLEPKREHDHFGSIQKFFRGATTRVLWISLGGGIFFSTYELAKRTIYQYSHQL